MRLFLLELKRILKMKQVILLLITGFCLTLLMAYVPVSFEKVSYKNEQGEKVTLKGKKAIQYKQKLMSQYDGKITDKKLKNALRQYQMMIRENGIDDSEEWEDTLFDIYTKQYIPIKELLHIIQEGYIDKDGKGKLRGVVDISVREIKDCDKQLERHLNHIVEMEHPGDNAILNVANKKYKKVNKPLEIYGYFSTDSYEYVEFLLIFLMLLCVMIATPVFSDEYQNGSDAIFRCTKYGRFQLALTRLATIFLISFVYVLICICLQISIINVNFGTGCLKTSVQVAWSIVTLSASNLGQLQNNLVKFGILTILSMVSCTLFISSKCKITLTSIVLSLFVCVTPIIISIVSGKAWITYIFPSSGIGLNNNMLYQLTDFNIVKIGKWAIWPPDLTVAVTTAELLVFTVLAVRNYCVHEVT